MTATLNTEPLFSPEAQETFTVGSRVFLKRETAPLGEGAEGTYAGHLRERLAVVDFDTPSGEPYRLACPFDTLRNLYR